MFSKKTASFELVLTVQTVEMKKNPENDGGLDTFNQSIKVPCAALFTPGLSHTALFEGLNLHSINCGALR